MPSKSKRFTLRVTEINDDDAKSFLCDKRRNDYIDKLLKKTIHFAVREVGGVTEKPHYHSVHFSGKSTLRDRLLELGWTGNENHAFTPFEDDSDENYLKVMRYVCKGEAHGVLPVVVSNTMNITEDLILKYHNEWYLYSCNSSEEKKQKKSDEERKKDWFYFLVNFCKSKGLHASSSGWEFSDVIFDAYQEKVKVEPNDFQIGCYVKSIQRHLVYEASVELDAPEIWSNYKKMRAREIIGNSWVHPNDFIPKNLQAKMKKVSVESLDEKKYEDDYSVDLID